MSSEHQKQSHSSFSQQFLPNLGDAHQIARFNLSHVDCRRKLEFFATKHLVRIDFKGLFDKEIVVKRVDEFQVDVTLPCDELLPLTHRHLLHGLKVVVLLIGQQPGYNWRVLFRDFVNFVRQELR